MGQNWHQAAQEQWDSMSSNWHARSKEMWEKGSRKDIVPFFHSYLDKPPQRILDAGCGDGYGSYLLARRGYSVIGMDLSSEMITRAESWNGNDLDLEYITGDLIYTHFADQTFDGILSVNALEWTEHPIDAIHEFRRIIKSGGILCLAILGPTAGPRNHSYKRLYKERVICNTMMPWEASRLITEKGFTLLDGMGVYKEGVNPALLEGLSDELKQALSFLWMFIFRRN